MKHENEKKLQQDAFMWFKSQYGKTPAQICLRWHLENGFIPLPKSVTPSRIVENTEIFDFSISADDLALISEIDIDTGTGYDPDKVAW